MIRSFDFETAQFRPGEQAPPIICGSSADEHGGYLHVGRDVAAQRFEQLLREPGKVAFANAAFDLAVLANARPDLFPLIFQALREGKNHDILIAQSLDAIYGGHLGLDPETFEDLRSPTTGKPSKRYSLEIVTWLLTGRKDAKSNDVWRKSYALLEGIPESDWPVLASKYPIDDAVNTRESAIIQIEGKPLPHAWQIIPGVPGIVADAAVCSMCGQQRGLEDNFCPKAQRTPHRNLGNLREQTEAAFAAWLGACHGFRTDPQKVAELAAVLEEKNKKFVERFKAKGWIRDDDTEDTNAVKKAVAAAYEATGTCKRCGGLGRITTFDACRGEKVKGRFRGCVGDGCGACGGSGTMPKIGPTCKNVFDDDGALVENGCDGTGFDLDTAPLMPRSDKQGVKTNRDTLSESGDEDLADYGENEFQKGLTTYIPYLQSGISQPLTFSPNVLVATGRYSYEGSPLHQMPRAGKERGCIRARGAWCGSPIEYVLSSTDYEAGELVTFAQYTYWVLGFSSMRDIINESGSPGILHSDLAAEVLGIPLPEFFTRLKAKDKQCVDFRQASKPNSFGTPGGMGVPKLVMTARAKNSGFTECEGGPARNEKGREGYWGVRFCVLVSGAKSCGVEKVTQWKKRACSPVCKACCEIVENIMRPAYHRRYPEVKDYFDWVGKRIERREPAISLVWDAQEGRPRIIRERGFDNWNTCYSAYCNNSFQSMLADVLKRAYVEMTQECYLEGYALSGSRVPLVIHDEPLGELILDRAHEAGPRIAEIMVDAGKALAPDLVWKAETALAFWWDKSMEPVYKDGKLVPWVPK